MGEVYCPARHRPACAVHALRRAEQRGVEIGPDEILRLETAIETLRPAFEVPGQDRYWLIVKRAGSRYRVLYDVRMGCLVTVWR